MIAKFTRLDGRIESFDPDQCLSDPPVEMIAGGPALAYLYLPDGRCIEQRGYLAPGWVTDHWMEVGGSIFDEWKEQRAYVPDAYHAEYREIDRKKPPETSDEVPDLVTLDQAAAATPDFAALAAKLRKARKPTQANLVEYMADKEQATVEDVANHVHADPKTNEKTLRANANRTSDSLAELGVPLSFRVASGRVFRDIFPK